VKRVLLVVWGFEPFGGMEQHVLQLACALRRAGVEVAVLSEMPVARSNFYARRLHAEGISLFAAPLWAWIANGLHIALRPSQAGKDQLIHGGGLLSRWLRGALDRLAGQGDLIHIHGCRLGQTWLVDWARRRGVASVYTEHVAIDEHGGPLTAQGPRLAREVGVLACVSEHSRESLQALFAQPRPIAITGHIIAAPPLSRSAPAIETSRFEILCAARLETHKGIDVLLRAFVLVVARRPDAHLTLAGSGALAAELKQLAGELGVAPSVTFAGALPPDRMADALNRADAVALASRSEGLPLALLEAMAAAKPVVVTRAGGMPEVIRDDENGLLAPTDDPDALAEALSRLACDAQLRARLGAAAQLSFRQSRHHEGHVIPEILDLYRQAEGAC
jgi:teichuronic acid biosynthesis glycosyltransferase TuaC